MNERSTSSVARVTPGAVFGNDFEIVRALRSGGMGTVYVALQKSTGRERALKLMLPQLVADPVLRKRFDQEARIASLIESDHVVEVVGAGVDELSGVPWLAMELLDGSDLEDVVSKRGPMSLDAAHRVLRQICHALSAAHAAGIVHRDLKPENVFLARGRTADEASVVKVLDFGIAKIAAEATASNTAAIGSPIWMAPEQTERGQITTAADVWAIGLIGFYLLTGRCFWLSADDPSGTVQQIMREALFAPIPTAAERARKYGVEHLLPVWFSEWFSSCVVRDPTLRFPTASKAFARFDKLCDSPVASGQISHAPSALSIPRPVSSSGGIVADADTNPTGPTLFASLDRPGESSEPIRSVPRAATSRFPVRPWIIVVGIALIGAALTVLRLTRPDQPEITVHRGGTPFELPPELASTPGGEWFVRVRSRCNPVEGEILLQTDPPPHQRDGVGFEAACLILSGKLDRARTKISALAPDDARFAVWPVFEVVHPIADAGDDASAGPAMRLVLEFWPTNYMALYHAGMSEYRTGDPTAAKKHLEGFLALYKQHDGFVDTANKILLEMSSANAKPDCSAPIATDPEGRKVFAVGCEGAP